MKYKLSLILLLVILIFSVGCTKETTETFSEKLIGNWKVVSIQCEEEDIKADILAGNIIVTLEITEDEMIMTANDYADPPLKYKVEDEKIVFEESNFEAGFEEEGFTLEMTFDGHSYKYLLIKLDPK